MGSQLQQGSNPLIGLSGASGFREQLSQQTAQSPLQQLLSSFQLPQQQQGFGTGLGGQDNELSALINAIMGQGQSLSK